MNRMNMNMNQGRTSAVTGLAVAMIAGTEAYMMSDHPKSAQKQTRKLKKAAGQAARNAGVVFDSISDLMR